MLKIGLCHKTIIFNEGYVLNNLPIVRGGIKLITFQCWAGYLHTVLIFKKIAINSFHNRH